MALVTIYKGSSMQEHRYYRDNLLVGTARYTYSFAMNEMVVYKDNHEEYRLSEVDEAIWFLRNCIPLVSIILSIFINGRYAIFQNNTKVGHSQDKWVKRMQNFVIHDDCYHLSRHRDDRFSLLKNGKQVALYTKQPIQWLRSCPSAYYISFSNTEAIEIIELFCILIDVFAFTTYNGTTPLKTLFLHDPHPEYAQWQPEE